MSASCSVSPRMLDGGVNPFNLSPPGGPRTASAVGKLRVSDRSTPPAEVDHYKVEPYVVCADI